MVLRKKGATPSKRVQGKKAFEVDNEHDSDFDGDSGEEMVVQKTPKNKTPQGRNSQSMSAKKVSFELSGKKTPGKTPQKNNSFVGKKQPTSVAKGMKGNKGVQKKKSQIEEIDDDDEDDDDFELDMDEDDDSDDDNEDDDDNEVDDDNEDDDDGEEEEQIQKSNFKKLSLKQTPKRKSSSKDDSDEEEEQIQKLKKVNTPTKGADKSKEQQMPKANTPSKVKEDEKAAVWEMNAERRRERDLVTLFAGNLSLDVTSDELSALSSDIIDVFISKSSQKTNYKYAFLRFSSVEKAEANCKALQGTELKGRVLKIAFKHEKNKESASVNNKELLINGIPNKATIADVATCFPKAYVVSMVGAELNRSAKIGFNKEEDAAEAYNLKEIKIHGQKLVILFAPKFASKKNYRSKGKDKRKFKHQGYNPAKKMKFSKSRENGD